MDSSTKLALAIVLSAALLLFGFIGYHEYQRQRDISDAQAMFANIVDQGKHLAQQVQVQSAEEQQRQREAVAMQWDRRLLQGNQRCVDGVVIVQNGTSFTQLGTVGDPVRCSGAYADRPIR